MEVKTQVLLYLGWVAIAVFCVEFLIRLCAKGFVGYLTNGGEIWRFLCLATLLARQIFTYFVKPAVPIFDLSFLRIVEFSAVFYRYEAFRSVRVVGETLQRSLRGVVQVMMILTLIIILFGGSLCKPTIKIADRCMWVVCPSPPSQSSTIPACGWNLHEVRGVLSISARNTTTTKATMEVVQSMFCYTQYRIACVPVGCSVSCLRVHASWPATAIACPTG